jgi:hypothetical protein
VEPLGIIAGIAAQYGIKQVIGALTGSNTVGDVASELFGALSASTEQIDKRLARVEELLHEVLDQQFRIAYKRGFSYLAEASRPGRAKTDRQADLERARDSLISASSAARDSLQSALAERLQALACVALEDTAAADGCRQRLEVAIGEVVEQAHTMHTSPWNVAQSAVEQGHYGSRSQLQAWFSSDDPRRDRAAADIRRAASDTMSIAAELLHDVSALCRILEVPERAVPRSLAADSLRNGELIVDAVLGVPARMAGLECTIIECAAIPNPTWGVEVRALAELRPLVTRRAAGRVTMGIGSRDDSYTATLDLDMPPLPRAGVTYERSGEAVRLTVTEHITVEEPVWVNVCISGLRFATSVPRSALGVPKHGTSPVPGLSADDLRALETSVAAAPGAKTIGLRFVTCPHCNHRFATLLSAPRCPSCGKVAAAAGGDTARTQFVTCPHCNYRFATGGDLPGVYCPSCSKYTTIH